MNSIDYELLLKIAAIVVGLIGTLYQFRNWRLTSRSSIKTDLEILEKLDPLHPQREMIQQSIDEAIVTVYGEPNKKKFKIYSPVDFYLGLLFLIGFSYWTYILSREGFSFWSILTGFVAFGGLGGMLNGVDPNRKRATT